jgi:hypothetical protein
VDSTSQDSDSFLSVTPTPQGQVFSFNRSGNRTSAFIVGFVGFIFTCAAGFIVGSRLFGEGSDGPWVMGLFFLIGGLCLLVFSFVLFNAPSRWRLQFGHLEIIRPFQFGSGRSMRVQDIAKFDVVEAYRLNDVPYYALKAELKTKQTVTLISGIPQNLKSTIAADIAERLGARHLQQGE